MTMTASLSADHAAHQVRRVLRVIPTLDSKFGGPVAAMTASVREMSRRDILTDILVADNLSVNEHQFGSNPHVRIFNVGRPRTRWRYVRHHYRWLVEHLPDYDLVIVHDIWPHAAYATWRASRSVGARYVVFVHGSLDQWYMRGQPLKYAKKWLTWPWAQYPVMRDAAAVLFTTEQEITRARHSFRPYSCRPVLVRYGTTVPDQIHVSPRPRPAPGYVLYLGRIHPKKGLDLLIRALALAQAAGRFDVVIAGTDQVGLQRKLIHLARSLGVEKRISWVGHVNPPAKWELIQNASALVLPSHTENFGVSVAEGLGLGVPALVTDKVNIAPVIQEAGAGFVANDDVAGVASLLDSFAGLSDTERETMSLRARSLYRDKFTVEGAVDDLLALASGSIVECKRHP